MIAKMTRSVSNDFFLRPMEVRDMATVVEIEEISFPRTQRWNKNNLIYNLRRRNFPVVVIEDRTIVSPPVIGFMIYEPCENCFGLIDLAVHHDWRNKGIARTLLQYLRNTVLEDGQVRNLLALVPRSLHEARRFCERNALSVVITDVKGNWPPDGTRSF